MVAGSSRFPAVRASGGGGRRCWASGVGGFGIWVAQRQQPAAARRRVAIELFEMAVAEIERLQRPAEPTDRTAHAEVVALRLRCPQQVRAVVIGASLVAIRVMENEATPAVLDTRIELGLEASR